jgi:hypothetical protein
MGEIMHTGIGEKLPPIFVKLEIERKFWRKKTTAISKLAARLVNR